MADIDAQVSALKKRITAVQQERARAEQQQAVARDRVATAEKALREEFGVEPEDVPALSAKLVDDLAAEVRRVAELLDKAEEKS